MCRARIEASRTRWRRRINRSTDQRRQERPSIRSDSVPVPDHAGRRHRTLRELVNRGVRIRISTNSLASTDNIQAFSGYQAQREDLLEAGVELYEYMDEPSIQHRAD